MEMVSTQDGYEWVKKVPVAQKVRPIGLVPFFCNNRVTDITYYMSSEIYTFWGLSIGVGFFYNLVEFDLA
jgi:hypothetical protein